VQLSYAIGIPHPLSINVDSYGTVTDGHTDDDLAQVTKICFQVHKKYLLILQSFVQKSKFLLFHTFFGIWALSHPEKLKIKKVTNVVRSVLAV
jgi:S-adenosylmethionine synthetase